MYIEARRPLGGCHRARRDRGQVEPSSPRADDLPVPDIPVTKILDIGTTLPSVKQDVLVGAPTSCWNAGLVSARTSASAPPQPRRSVPPLAHLLQGTSECLAAREHGFEQVTVPFDPLERLAHPEAARRHVLR